MLSAAVRDMQRAQHAQHGELSARVQQLSDAVMPLLLRGEATAAAAAYGAQAGACLPLCFGLHALEARSLA